VKKWQRYVAAGVAGFLAVMMILMLVLPYISIL